MDLGMTNWPLLESVTVSMARRLNKVSRMVRQIKLTVKLKDLPKPIQGLIKVGDQRSVSGIKPSHSFRAA
jgi:hypothetical protein